MVRCFGGSVETGDQYIVMELMEASLYDLLQDSSFDLDDDLRYEFALQTAQVSFCRAFLFLIVFSTPSSSFISFRFLFMHSLSVDSSGHGLSS